MVLFCHGSFYISEGVLLSIHTLFKIKNFFLDLFHYPVFTGKPLNYDDYWKVRLGDKKSFKINSFQTCRAQFIMERIEANDSILDLGAGEGSILLYLKSKLPIQLFATDSSPLAVNYLNSMEISAKILELNHPDSIKTLDDYDHICALELLEHLPRSEDFLLAMIPKAKKSVFFSFPNTGYIKDRLRLLLGRFPLQWKSHPGEHLRFWTYRDLCWWLKSLNLYDQAEIQLYEGIPLLNKILPSLFAKAMIVQIKNK